MLVGMARLCILALAIASACNTTAADAQYPRDGVPCHRTVFQTELIRDACSNGGQLAAQLAMTRFAKQHEVYSCLKCHATLGPNYNLRPEGPDTFARFGGR